MSEMLRCLDHAADTGAADGSEIQQMYDDKLDAVIMREALPVEAVAVAAGAVGAEGATDAWARPNRPVPIIDLRLLGMGAAPCATMPTGPAEDEYLDAAEQTPAAIRGLFGEGLDPFTAIEERFKQLAGCPADVPRTGASRPFSPCTVRAIPAGAGLMVHHDNHYQLPVYDGVRGQIDTSALLSFFVVLGRPAAGGRLCVFGRGPQDDPDLPFLDSGLPDPEGFFREVPHQYFDLGPGDLIVFASSRLYHTVERVQGASPRVTMGGFMGLNPAHSKLLYWS